MNQFNLNVSVNIDLSEDTKAFLKNLLGVSAAPAVQASKPAVSAPASMPATPASKPVATTASVTKPTAPVVSKAETAPAATATATAATAPAATATIGIEQVREVLKNKVNTHREAIKAKLDELGAPSVTKLDPSLYTELYNFLQSLA